MKVFYNDKAFYVKKVAIIGPECTGKTSISQSLAIRFCGAWEPEYAREYIEKLNRKYTYNDVEKIARHQHDHIMSVPKEANGFVFFDTELIITKVWFGVVFNKEPEWLDEAIRNSGFDLYLLCLPDIPWEPDSVRENGGENRLKLFQQYKDLLNYYQFSYEEVSGIGNLRNENAFIFINKLNKQYGT